MWGRVVKSPYGILLESRTALSVLLQLSHAQFGRDTSGMDTHTLRQSIHRSQRNALSAVVLVALVAFAMPALTQTARAQNAVTVAWDANPETDIAGYKLYLGTVSGTYSQIQDVGNRPRSNCRADSLRDLLLHGTSL